LVILAGTLATFNLPIEGIAVILGVDTLMDMARTSVSSWPIGEGVDLARSGDVEELSPAAAAAAGV
jgi:hypothetical protein